MMQNEILLMFSLFVTFKHAKLFSRIPKLFLICSYKCLPVNFAKIFKNSFFTEHFRATAFTLGIKQMEIEVPYKYLGTVLIGKLI